MQPALCINAHNSTLGTCMCPMVSCRGHRCMHTKWHLYKLHAGERGHLTIPVPGVPKAACTISVVLCTITGSWHWRHAQRAS